MKRSIQCFALTTRLTFLLSRWLQIDVRRGFGGVAPRKGDTFPSTLSFILGLIALSYLINSLNAAIGFPATISGKNSFTGISPLASFSLLALRFTPPPPPDRGAPGNRGEGASRGDCAIGEQPLTALVPSYEQLISSTAAEPITVTQVWGLTSRQHPSFWFYVPYDSEVIRQIEFVLQTEDNQTLYRLPVSIPASPGIVEVKVPSTETPLAVDQPYHWFFKVRVACNTETTTVPPVTGTTATGSTATDTTATTTAATLEYVEGWVQRVDLETGLTDRLSQASALQQAELYAENGIWYDALTTLADLHRANPQDGTIATSWVALLETVGLQNLATQTIWNVED